MGEGRRTKKNSVRYKKNETVNGIHWVKIKNKRYLSRNGMVAEGERKTNAPTHTHVCECVLFQTFTFVSAFLFVRSFFYKSMMDARKIATVPSGYNKKKSSVKIHCWESTHFSFNSCGRCKMHLLEARPVCDTVIGFCFVHLYSISLFNSRCHQSTLWNISEINRAERKIW